MPKVIRNHPLNLTPLKPEVHSGIHGRGVRKFDPITRTWVGMPDWAKATTGANVA